MEQFHFIRPDWLFALIPLALIMLLLHKVKIKHSDWRAIIPAHLVNVLLDSNSQSKHHAPLWMLYVTWLIATIALAGPTWQKLPQPVYQVKAAKLLIMDMSLSMRATDITPNRLTRARYKAIDLINTFTDGDAGLIAYANDAFVISPLTPDYKNIISLIPSLKPELMPAQGSNPIVALNKADELFRNAGYTQGDIYLITDGIDYQELSDIQRFIKKYNHRLNILGVGTQEGAPITLENGELLKDNAGSIVIPKINTSQLRALARSTNGYFVSVSSSDNDIKKLANIPELEKMNADTKESNEDQFGDQWQDMGVYLIFIILPFAAYAFRRGVISGFAIVLLIGTLSPTPVYANWWDNLWQTQNQQAKQLYDNKQFEQAAETFNDPKWQGAASYKSGDYEQALEHFKKDNSAEGLYNQGNALAQLNKFDDAINAYEEALKLDPDFEEAKKNKQVIEQIKAAMENQQQNNDNNQSSDSNDSSEDGEQSEQSNKSDKNANQNTNQNNEQAGNQESKQNSESQNQQNNTEQQSDSEQQSQLDNASNAQNNENEQANQQQNDSPQPRSPESSNQPEDQNKDALSQNKEQDTRENENADQQNMMQQEQDKAAENKDNESVTAAAQPTSELSAEEKEQQQVIQQLMRKVNDDPAILLRNKMQLEHQKRRRNGFNRGADKKW
ncbi:tetratricopeptide repeat protein [Flocculibacter collagenilyticus]|uniref:tetratricopeptide repeat protein n=1 Tax=Flocculibacter collagenilyticus TaxID=2744479 RepID=UPI0018F5549A|nr:tetratricopeptide repeat protein [Flocculibacter collagenilyticus]